MTRRFRSRFEKLLTAAAFAALVVAFLLPHADGPAVCPFRLMTGLLCPGCGLTHAFVAMADLRVGDAFAANAFGPLAFVIVLGFAVTKLAEIAAGRLLVARRTLVLLGLAGRGLIAIWIAWAAVRAFA